MIQKDTLEALNYFLQESKKVAEMTLEDINDSKSRLRAYYLGVIAGLSEAIELINQDWKST